MSRSHLRDMQPAAAPNEVMENVLFHNQRVKVGDLVDIPVSATPVESIEWRVQVCTEPLPVNNTQRQDDWDFINPRLYCETSWWPYNRTDLFSTDKTNVVVDFATLFNISTSFDSLLAMENARYAVRAQNKDKFGAFDSFYPEYPNYISYRGVLPGNTAQGLNDPKNDPANGWYPLETLKRAVVDNFRPFAGLTA